MADDLLHRLGRLSDYLNGHDVASATVTDLTADLIAAKNAIRTLRRDKDRLLDSLRAIADRSWAGEGKPTDETARAMQRQALSAIAAAGARISGD